MSSWIWQDPIRLCCRLCRDTSQHATEEKTSTLRIGNRLQIDNSFVYDGDDMFLLYPPPLSNVILLLLS